MRDPNPSVAHHNTLNPFTMPAQGYLALANTREGEERQALLLMASGRLIYDGQLRRAQDILKSLSPDTAVMMSEKNILLAKMGVMQHHSQTALAQLSAVHNVSMLPLYYQAQYHEILASAYRAMHRTVQSVEERIQLENILPDEGARVNNRRALWLTITTLSPAELHTLALEAPASSILKGWMELGLVARQQDDDPVHMLAAIEQWESTYPTHPGHYILPVSTDRVREHLFAPPHRIAALLPLTGPLSGPGQAVRDGLMAASAASTSAHPAQLIFYDTGDASVAGKLYQQAISEGADYVIGPLGKVGVSMVASLDHPVPTLLLNDGEIRANRNLYQFGIAPASEARQVAMKARRNGLSHALIFAPDDVWGTDVLSAFLNQWRANGGEVADIYRYRQDEDMEQVVRTALHAAPSSASSAKSTRSQLIARRRQDFDMVFLLAYPSKARAIMPMLRYYGADKVPVYGTSSVYGGSMNTVLDRDLDGLIFCDMPWVFKNRQGDKRWPETWNSYNRLYALGMDSYALAFQLNQLFLFPAMGASEQSGTLYLTANQQIARILTWGQFRQGVAEPIEE